MVQIGHVILGHYLHALSNPRALLVIFGPLSADSMCFQSFISVYCLLNWMLEIAVAYNLYF